MFMVYDQALVFNLIICLSTTKEVPIEATNTLPQSIRLLLYFSGRPSRSINIVLIDDH